MVHRQGQIAANNTVGGGRGFQMTTSCKVMLPGEVKPKIADNQRIGNTGNGGHTFKGV
jgi:hypothetical protein